jgi:hypothetical protein
MHPSIAKAHALLVDRAEREREHAAWLDRRAVDLANHSCDALLARLAAPQPQPAPSDELVYKDCHANFSEAPPDPIFSYRQQCTIAAAISMLRAEFIERQDQQNIDLAARLSQIEADIEDLDQRITELESASNGSGYAG